MNRALTTLLLLAFVAVLTFGLAEQVSSYVVEALEEAGEEL